MASITNEVNVDDRPTKPAPEATEGGPVDPEIGDSSMREVVCEFTANAPFELGLQVGDNVIEIEPADGLGWCLGLKDDGTQGYYPSTYVKTVPYCF